MSETPLKLHLHGGWTDTVITVIYSVEEGRKTGRKAKFGGKEKRVRGVLDEKRGPDKVSGLMNYFLCVCVCVCVRGGGDKQNVCAQW